MAPASKPTTTPTVTLDRPVDAQASVVPLLADLDALRLQIEAAIVTLNEAERAKQAWHHRYASSWQGSSPDVDDPAAIEHRFAITQALDHLKALQRQRTDTQDRLDQERRVVRDAMANRLLNEYSGLFSEFAALLEAVDIRWRALTDLVGAANALFPMGQRPFSGELLSGSNASVARKLRSLARR